MHRVLGQDGAVNAVVGVRGHRADRVRRVDVLDGQGLVHLLEVPEELVPEPWAHVCQLRVPPRVLLARALQQGVTTALSHDDHGVALLLHELHGLCEDFRQGDVHLWQHADVHAARRQGPVHGNEPAVPAHQLHEPNAVCVAGGLHVRRCDRLLGLRARRVEAEGPVHDRDVVVDGLGHAHDRNLVANLLRALESVHGARLGAVSANDKVLRDVHLLERLCNVDMLRVAPVAHQNGPALHVDVLDGVRRQLHPLLRLYHALVASDAPKDVWHAVTGERHDDLPNDRVQPWAKSTTSDNHRGTLRRVKVQDLARAASQHLVVDVAAVVALVEARDRLRGPGILVQEDSAVLWQHRIGDLR
mmetsp:Transcript_59552/g.169406  ORF Transcript_59552/g.169406 Transcript_59552/m.169406 type:complete len:359 (-) Transcript_59552:2319-3395(-)